MTKHTINIEPSWIAVAHMSITNILDGQNPEHGKRAILDMAYKLACVRASQENCPDHLKNPVDPNPGEVT